MRLVREILAADAEPAMAQADAPGRATRFLAVVAGGLGLRAGAVLLRNARTGQLDYTATTLPDQAGKLLGDPAGRVMALMQRAAEERRAFLIRRAGDDVLLQALHAADPSIQTLAILPLVDRAPVGILVLAGDDGSLAAETIRTLNPALRLFAVLVSPSRDGAPSDPALLRDLEAARAEGESRSFEIAQLRARIDELETAARRPADSSPAEATQTLAAAVAATVRKVGDLVAEVVAPEAPAVDLVVVIDAATAWESFAIRDHRIVALSPAGDVVPALAAAPPGRVIVNVAAEGAFASLVALRTAFPATPVWGVVGDQGGERLIGLGLIEAVMRPGAAEALAAAVERHAPRGARVFAAGRDADALMKTRQLLTKQGFSVSTARDAKQIDELLDMVKPQVVVVDLELPTRAGYELIMRAALMVPTPALIVIPPEGDPVPALVDKLRDRLAGGHGMGAKQWLADLVTKKIPAVTGRARRAAPPAHAG